MALRHTPPVHLDWPAVDFNLLGTDGLFYNLSKIRGENGLVVMFICNHCPYVRKVIQQICDTMYCLKSYGVHAIAVMPNNVKAYPEDGYEHMQQFHKDHSLTFPYVIDVSQKMAQDYGAICTPDFFGFNKDLKLQYRGRIDEQELLNAMIDISQVGHTSSLQKSSIGCSLK